MCVNTPLKDDVEEYRAACVERGWRLDSLSLERITGQILGEHDLLLEYFKEVSPDSVKEDRKLRRFDCGLRLKEAREDLCIPESRLIEEIDFPSEREWKSVESEELDIAERYVEAMANLSDISSAWLKHGISNKYPTELIYDNQSSKIDAIAGEGMLSAYMAIEPVSMNSVLIVKFTEYRWRVYPFGFSMDFWNWIDDHHHIPVIFELLQKVHRMLKNPDGRIVSQDILEELTAEDKHPSISFKKAGSISYWFDDLFDLHYRHQVAKDNYRQYGEWFTRLQEEFRANVKSLSSSP